MREARQSKQETTRERALDAHMILFAVLENDIKDCQNGHRFLQDVTMVSRVLVQHLEKQMAVMKSRRGYLRHIRGKGELKRIWETPRRRRALSYPALDGSGFIKCVPLCNRLP